MTSCWRSSGARRRGPASRLSAPWRISYEIEGSNRISKHDRTALKAEALLAVSFNPATLLEPWRS
eukprot:1427808-Prymnesium_polylepis.1